MKKQLLTLAILATTALSAQTVWLPTKAARTQLMWHEEPTTTLTPETITWEYDQYGNTINQVIEGDTTYTRKWTKLPTGILVRTFDNGYVAEYDAKGMLLFRDAYGEKQRTIVNAQGIRTAVQKTIIDSVTNAETWVTLPYTFDSKGHVLTEVTEEEGTLSYTWDDNGRLVSATDGSITVVLGEFVYGAKYFDEWSLSPIGGDSQDANAEMLGYPDMDNLRQWNDNTLRRPFANMRYYLDEMLVSEATCTLNGDTLTEGYSMELDSMSTQYYTKYLLLENGGYTVSEVDIDEEYFYEYTRKYDKYGALTLDRNMYYEREYDAEGRPTKTTCMALNYGAATVIREIYTETYSAWTEKGTVDIQTVDMDDAIQWTAYAKDGYITVEGIDDYIIVNTSGAILPANKTLPTGIYFVSANGKTQKVIVP